MQITEATSLLKNQQNYNKHSPLAQDIVSLSGENYFLKKLSYKKSDVEFSAPEELTAKVHFNNGPVKHKNQTPCSLNNVKQNEFSKICLYYATDILGCRSCSFNKTPKTTSDALISSTSISSCDDSDKSKPHDIRKVTFCDENGDMIRYSKNYIYRSSLADKFYFHDDRGISSICGSTKSDKLCLYDHTNTSRWKSYDYSITTKIKSGIVTGSNVLRNVEDSDQSHNIDETTFHNENDICEFITSSNNQKVKNKNEIIPFFKPRTNKNKFYANEYPLPIYKNSGMDIDNIHFGECTIQINGYLTNNFNHNKSETFYLNLKTSVLEGMCLNNGLMNVHNSTNYLLSNIFKYLNNDQSLQLQDNSEVQCELLSTPGKHQHPSAILALSFKSGNMPKYFKSLTKKHGDDKQLSSTERIGNHLLPVPAHMSTRILDRNCGSIRKIAGGNYHLAGVIFNKSLRTESLKTSNFPENVLLLSKSSTFPENALLLSKWSSLSENKLLLSKSSSLSENKLLLSQSYSLSENNILLNKSMWLLKVNHSLSTRNVTCPASLPNNGFSECMEIQPVPATRNCLIESEDQPSYFVGTIYMWSMLILLKAMVNAFACIK